MPQTPPRVSIDTSLALVLSLLALALLVPASVSAQSMRAAHAVGLFVDRPAVLLASDRALLAESPEGALTVCAYASGACRPIRSAQACSGDRCPSGGWIVELEGSVADVPAYPDDRDGRARELQAISADTNVRALANHVPRPQPPSPPPTFHLEDGHWRLELALGGGVASRPEAGLALGSLWASFGWGIGVDWDDEEILQILFGNVIGADLRVRVLPSVIGGSFEQASVQIGVGGRTLWAPEREPFRIAAGYLSLMPEVGVITRPDRDASFYFGWSIPVSVALDAHFGMELRGWVYIVDDWVEGDDVAWLLGADLALLAF